MIPTVVALRFYFKYVVYTQSPARRPVLQSDSWLCYSSSLMSAPPDLVARPITRQRASNSRKRNR